MSKFVFYWILFLATLSPVVIADEFDDFLKREGTNSIDAVPAKPSKAPNTLEVQDLQELAPKEKSETKHYTKSVLAHFKNWTVLTANPKDNKVCYSITYSKKRIGNIVIDKAKSFKPYFMVHYFSPFKQRISIFFDYKLHQGSSVFISIDGKQFEFHPLENYAFALDAETDSGIISALLHSNKILVRGEGPENTYSVDEYSSIGFVKAYNEMKSACKKIVYSANV